MKTIRRVLFATLAYLIKKDGLMGSKCMLFAFALATICAPLSILTRIGVGGSPVYALGNGPAFINPISVTIEADGSIIVADRGELSDGRIQVQQAVIRVNPISGDRTIVSDNTTGSGPLFNLITGIDVEADGSLVVTGSDADFNILVFRVDPLTGDRSIVSGAGVGSGVPLSGPRDIAVEAAGSLVVADSLTQLFRIDPLTGDRSILAEFPITSPLWVLEPFGVTVRPDGNLFVISSFSWLNCEFIGGPCHPSPIVFGVVQVDPVTGQLTPVSGPFRGSGPDFENPFDIADANGILVVVDAAFDAVIRVNPITGGRHIVSGCSVAREPCPQALLVGRGPQLQVPTGVAGEATGDLIIVDTGLDAVIRVNPVSGDRVLVSQ